MVCPSYKNTKRQNLFLILTKKMTLVKVGPYLPHAGFRPLINGGPYEGEGAKIPKCVVLLVL